MKSWETAGLFVAWVIHDIEEWFTAGPWSRTRAADPAGPSWLRRLPWMRHGVSDHHQRAAIIAMGFFVASAALDGLRTAGRSTYFRSFVLAFGLHGLGHMAASAALGTYTPGVATTPVTVLPYAAWALRRSVQEHDSLGVWDAALGAVILPMSLGLAHAVGKAVVRSGTPRSSGGSGH